MIDLEFDSTPEAEVFVEMMQRIWGGAGQPSCKTRVRVLPT